VSVVRIYSWSKDHGKILAAAVLLILVIDAMWGNILYFTANNGNRYDWRSAFALVNEGKQEGDLFVSTYPKLGQYYTGEEMLQYTFESPTSIQQAGRRAWFVLDFNKSWANVDLKPWVEANARLLNVFYLRTPEYLNLRVYLYDPQE
jgi:hypothetical protein